MLKVQPRTEPEQIGKYLIRRRIGRGSMGMVYEAYDPFVQRSVALKVAIPEAGEDPARQQAFRRSFFVEAHAAGTLQHPHIVSVFDAGMHGKQAYMVMEYVRGTTLKEHAREDALLSLEQAVDVTFKCAMALDYAHRHGVIHRDIKPANVMLGEDGVVKIMDFGIAKLERLEESQPAGLVGSPYYMSPEQVSEQPVGPPSDLYALGAVMFQLLTGRPPFLAESYHALIYQIVHVEPPRLRDLRPDLPASLDRLMSKALAKAPEDRFQSGAEFGSALTALYDSLRFAGRQIENIERRDMLRGLEFFKEFSTGEIEEVMYAARWVNFPAGGTVIHEGDIDDAFYIIVDGVAKVVKGPQQIGQLNTGDCFGEIGFLTHQRRNATIVSVTPLVLMKINASLMGQASQGCQLRYYKAFTEALIRRLAFLNRELMQR